MRRIAYISNALAMPEDEVAQLVLSAQGFNARHGITGFLLYNGRNFLQVVDGDAGTVGALMDRIEADPRHSGIVRLIDEPVDVPCAPDWSMQRISLADELAERRAGLETGLPALDPALERLVRGFALLN